MNDNKHLLLSRSFLTNTCSKWFALAVICAWAGLALGQTCYTSDDMDAPTRTALSNTAQRYYEMVAKGDSASLRQNSIPSVASDFGGIDTVIKDNQANLAGVHATARPPFLLKAEGTAPLARAEFLCGVFGANGQTSNSTEFVIPNLPPGNYGIATLDASTPKGPYTVSFVLQQQGNEWRIGGLYVGVAIKGHDGKWFAEQARAYKAKGQAHNAWFYFLQARQLMVPVPFMETQATDRLYDEFEKAKPADLPAGGNSVDLPAAGKTYKVTTMFPLNVGADLDLVVKYQSADVSDTGKAFGDNMAVMKALVTKYPELRDAFDGIVARAVEPSGKDYGSLLQMKDIK